MSDQQLSHATALQTSTIVPSHHSHTKSHESRDGPAQDDHILVHFNGEVDGHFNGAFMVPNPIYQKAAAESDAQIAARRAMSKRSSRSFASRISRTRSRKMEVLGRSTKPGITVDTSFTRHKGTAPHQMYPQELGERGSGSIRKQGWFGLGRSGTKNKGLGITKGTPQPDVASEAQMHGMSSYQPRPSTHRTMGSNGGFSQTAKDPKTADTITPGSKAWQEISPWDRPIPIGISIPSDSVTDFSPDQVTRQRSESDATLATPSIIITPADAMKSVWSPDTDSDYSAARASSIYSRATFDVQGTDPNAPPVPALPLDVSKLIRGRSGSQMPGVLNGSNAAHTRSDTLDSNGTAFEEEDDDVKRNDRIMSSGTVFEEDDTPLRERNFHSTLTVDTSIAPTPRRSQGWWNVITTPFVASRRNSVWTQHGQNMEKTPEVPVVPAEHSARGVSASSPSTYIWSATERSPSVRGESLLLPLSLSTATTTPEISERGQMSDMNEKTEMGLPTVLRSRDEYDSRQSDPTSFAAMQTTATAQQTQQRVASSELGNTVHPPIASASPDETPIPRQAKKKPPPININIEMLDRRPDMYAQTVITNAPPTTVAEQSTLKKSAPPQIVPVFPPPPTYAQKASHFSYNGGSRTSSPTSSTRGSFAKGGKEHRKVGGVMARFALCRRNKDAKTQEKKKKRTRCFLCCGCCIVILVLLAIIVPLVVVLTRKHNVGSKVVDPPSQWLNLTGYPPIPTGVSTIAQPEAVEEESGCVVPATLWSCALPKEQQKDISPNKPDQPNFQLEITYENKTQPERRAVNAVSAGSFIRSSLLKARAALSASPAPPSVEEMQFLGKTTDENSAPFEGEETPLFISFQDAKATTASRLAKRDDPDDRTNVTQIMPPPDLKPDGTAAEANLVPFPAAQPLRLFNRGKPDEHYGFYTFFDRSIFLKDITSSTGRGGNPADTNGGSLRDAAAMRCTYAQTRFLVQIWTRSQSTKPMLAGSAQNSSALRRPGSFPYPVTITLDRHGGDYNKKMLFCYKMENDTTIVDKSANKFFQFEDRAFGGNLVNGTQGRFNLTGPIDGGTGGCRCQWQNWLN